MEFGSVGGTSGGSFKTGPNKVDKKPTGITVKSGSGSSNKSSGGSSVANNNNKSTMNQSIAEGMNMFNVLTGGQGLSRMEGTKEYTESLQRSKEGEERAQKGVDRAELGVERAGLAVERYKKRATEGIGTAEREAQRTNMAQQMARAQQMAGLRLGAMAGGAQGASAAAQQRSLQAQGMQSLAGVERDIFLQSEAAKREGEDKLSLAERGVTLAEQGVTQAEAGVTQAGLATSRLQMEKAAFDIGQANAEVEMKTGLAMGIEGQKSAERSAAIAADAQIKASQAQSSGISVVCTELHSQGVIDTQVWKDSEAWGNYMGKADREFMKAYWAIGIPTVKLMQRSKIASFVLGPIFKQGFDYLGGKKTLLTKAGFLLGVGLCEISRYYLRLKNKMKVYNGKAEI